jgi:hypothetical protein
MNHTRAGKSLPPAVGSFRFFLGSNTGFLAGLGPEGPSDVPVDGITQLH